MYENKKLWSNKVISLIKKDSMNKCNILIPCRIIYAFIPIVPKTTLVFEEVILKLIGININNSKHIAEILCLDEEFVIYILNILKKNKLIDLNNNITSSGKENINQIENNRNINNKIDQYIIVGFIQNMLDGKLCDYLVDGNLEKYIYSDKMIYKDKKYIKIISELLEKKDINKPDDNQYKKIISINKKYNDKICKLGELDEINLMDIPENYEIEIDKESIDPERVYLHCQVEYYNNNIFVTDGYGSIVEEYIRKSNEEWLIDYIEHQTTSSLSYQPVIFEKYSSIEKYIIKINEHSNNKEDGKKIIDGIYYKDVYSLIENILYRILSDNNFLNYKNMKNYNSDVIKIKCTKIGFSYSEKYEFKCKEVITENSSFDDLISYIILLVDFTNNEKIKKLAKHHPDFILRMFELKEYRNNEAHGKENDNNISSKIKKFIDKNNIFSITKLLLPDLEVKNYDDKMVITIDDKLRNAIINVRVSLGNNFYDRLPDNIKDNLIKVFLHNEDVINNIYSSYQQLLVNAIAYYTLYDEKISVEQLINEYKNIIDIKYYSLLKNVKNNNIEKAANKGNSTLNGCLIVFMYMGKFFEVKKFFEDNPDFINDVAYIISERKHGNKLKYNENINDEKNKLLKYIKYFMREIYV